MKIPLTNLLRSEANMSLKVAKSKTDELLENGEIMVELQELKQAISLADKVGSVGVVGSVIED